ncbi:MAG: GspE/PulE family protein [bacterium]|nr:GspE/PulE family protein [bacterium]
MEAIKIINNMTKGRSADVNAAREKLETEINNGARASIVSLVNYVVELAHSLKASDVHIDPQADAIRIRLRIDGVLQDEIPFPKTIQGEIISRIKILAGLRTDEHQVAQDGRFRINLESGAVDIRVSIVPTYYGENAVLRLLKDQDEGFSLDSLGFSAPDRAKILKAIKYPYGMILATGPTGSGKTTTLYTLIKLLNRPNTSIITIEDPIEYSIGGINQIGVNPRTGLSFANGLRSILRQDPNIIMVGEIRDEETAGLAVNTALTGHLVLSTIHTNDAATTLPRLIDLKIEPYLIASTVNIAIGQRLVRKICEDCKEEFQITQEELQSLAEVVSPEILGKENTFYKGKGCSACNNTGYSGRVCINEVLVVDNAIRSAIHRKATAAEIKEETKKQKMTSMIEDGFLKAKSGITTIEEILRTLHE